MSDIRIIRNDGLVSAALAVPHGHSHIRLALTTSDGDTFVLQEAAVAAIVRAYTAIKTHPSRRAVKMVSTRLEGRKKGYAEHQLTEADVPDDDVEAEVTGLLRER